MILLVDFHKGRKTRQQSLLAFQPQSCSHASVFWSCAHDVNKHNRTRLLPSLRDDAGGEHRSRPRRVQHEAVHGRSPGVLLRYVRTAVPLWCAPPPTTKAVYDSLPPPRPKNTGNTHRGVRLYWYMFNHMNSTMHVWKLETQQVSDPFFSSSSQIAKGWRRKRKERAPLT